MKSCYKKERKKERNPFKRKKERKKERNPVIRKKE